MIGFESILQNRCIIDGFIMSHPVAESMTDEHLGHPFTGSELPNHLDGILHGPAQDGMIVHRIRVRDQPTRVSENAEALVRVDGSNGF